MTEQATEVYEGWAIVELMGHRKLAGKIREAEVAGLPMLRLDVYAGDVARPTLTQFYAGNSFYCITPSTENICRAFASQDIVQPVHRFELPPIADLTLPTYICSECGRDFRPDESSAPDGSPCPYCAGTDVVPVGQ